MVSQSSGAFFFSKCVTPCENRTKDFATKSSNGFCGCTTFIISVGTNCQFLDKKQATLFPRIEEKPGIYIVRLQVFEKNSFFSNSSFNASVLATQSSSQTDSISDLPTTEGIFQTYMLPEIFDNQQNNASLINKAYQTWLTYNNTRPSVLSSHEQTGVYTCVIIVTEEDKYMQNTLSMSAVVASKHMYTYLYHKETLNNINKIEEKHKNRQLSTNFPPYFTNNVSYFTCELGQCPQACLQFYFKPRNSTYVDPENDPVTINVYGLSWVSASPQTILNQGYLWGTYPPQESIGYNYTFYVSLDDGYNTPVVYPIKVKVEPPIWDNKNLTGSFYVGEIGFYNFPQSDNPCNNTYSITPTSPLPYFLSINGYKLSWNFGYSLQNKTYIFNLTEYDSILQISRSVQLTIDVTNRRPIFSPIPTTQQINAGQTSQYLINAYDPDGGSVTYSESSNAPFPVYLVGSLLIMTPSTTDSGTKTVTISVSDGVNSVTTSFNIIVVNLPPYFSPSLANQIVHSHLTSTFTIGTVDPEGGTVTITITGLQTWMTLSGQTLTMTPPISTSLLTNFTITVSITDGVNLVTQSLGVNVINNPPVFTAQFADQIISAGKVSSYTLPTISDYESDTISISLIAPLIPFVSISGSTITMAPSMIQIGTYTVSGQLFDGVNTVPFTFTTTVKSNQPPALSGTELIDQKVSVGTSILFDIIQPLDPEGDTVTITWQNLPTFVTVQTHQWQILISPAFTELACTYPVSVSLSDGQNSAVVYPFNIIVANLPPSISTVPSDQTVQAGQTGSITLDLSDPESNTVTASLSGQPIWVTISGFVITWNPPNTIQGTFPIEITISDGVYTASKSFNLVVTNQSPTFTSQPTDQTISAGTMLTYTLPATLDPEGNTVTITCVSCDGSISGTDYVWAPTVLQQGTFPVTISISDGVNSQVHYSFNVIVINLPPIFSASPVNQIGRVGVSSTYSLPSYSDPEGAAVTLVLVSNPAFVSLAGSILTINPELTDIGISEVTVSLSDGVNSAVLYSFKLDVVDLPSITVSAAISTAYAIPSISDVQNHYVTVTIVTGPSYAKILESNIIIYPGPLDIGTSVMTVSLSDGVNAAVIYSFLITVTNQSPALPGGSLVTQTVNVGASFHFDITQPLDPEGGALTITWYNLPSFVTVQTQQWQILIAPAFTEHAATYPVSVSISDGANAAIVYPFEIIVANLAPSFLTIPVNQYIVAGITSTYTLPGATDPEGANVVITISTSCPFPVTLSGLQITMSPRTSDGGIYPLTLTISDGINSVTSSFSIKITNLPPSFITQPLTQHVSVGSSLTYSLPSAIDPEGSIVVITATSLADFITQSGNKIIITPSDLVNAYARTIVVTLKLSDGYNIVTVTFNVIVANLPPSFISTPSTQTIHGGMTSFYVLPVASDPENTPTVITFTISPNWMKIVGPTISMKPLSNQIGSYPVTVQLSDGYNNVPYSFNVIVINSLPAFSTAPVTQTLTAGNTLSYTLPAISDYEHDLITITLIAPMIPFVSLIGQTIQIQPSITQNGTFTISGQISDGVNIVPFTFQVIVVLLPYFLQPLVNKVLAAGTTLTYTLPLAVDPQGYSMTITGILQSGAALPAFISLTLTQLKITSAITDAGIYPIIIKLSNGVNTVLNTVKVTVFARPFFPTALVNQQVTVGSILSYSIPCYPQTSNITIVLTTTQLLYSTLPSFVTFSGSKYNFAPTLASQVGSYTISVMLYDGYSTTTFTFTLNVLALPVLPALSQTGFNICNPSMKYCNSVGAFDSKMQFQYFEGSIALFQSGFYYMSNEQRTIFMNLNSHCAVQGYVQKQTKIQYIQQLGNNQNIHDSNTNSDDITLVPNSNSQANLAAFIGNILPLQRCSYVFNFAYNSVTGNITYQMTRHTISIEYQSNLKVKKTATNVQAAYQFTQKSTDLNYPDLPCSPTTFYFHPGLMGLIYLMDDNITLILKVDRTISPTADLCTTNFMDPSHLLWQNKLDIKYFVEFLLNFTVSSIPGIFVFLNNNLYTIVYGHLNIYGSTTQQSMIVQININIAAQTSSIVNVYTAFGIIDQITALELQGFLFTVKNQTGITLGKINTSTYSSITGTSQPTSTGTWKLYQTMGDNHLHRPIYAVSMSSVSTIYRVTSVMQLLIYDSTLKTNFYDYPLQTGRYHALVVNPGNCQSLQSTTDYDNMKAILINLRLMEVERCIDMQFIGCSDGKLSSTNGEQCDDGNLINGDGCSSTCQVEPLYTCTSVQSQFSTCTFILCGNGFANSGEECDDGNFISGDGCSSTCTIEQGYMCACKTCTKMCGDGIIQSQTGVVNNQQELCDGGSGLPSVTGCSATCQPVLGWTCTTSSTTMVSTCAQTCGNNLHDALEVCDDGNNVSGDGCSQGCLSVEAPYQCPLVGPCVINCGNGIFEGMDTSIGLLNGISLEQCDDGNNKNGDGCSNVCHIEPGWGCINVFQYLLLEIPIFKSVCTLTVP